MLQQILKFTEQVGDPILLGPDQLNKVHSRPVLIIIHLVRVFC